MERRYNEEEVGLILRKAMESSPGTRREESHAVTLSELKEIAGEVGIEPARIEAAARSLDAAESTVKRSAGIPTAVHLTRLVDVELREDDLPKMLIIIREVLARQGIVTEVLGGLEWQARSSIGGQYVSIRPQDGGTRLQVLGNFRDGVLGVGAATGFLGVFGGGALGAMLSLPTAAVVATTLAVGAVAGYAPWRLFFPESERTLNTLMDRLEAYLESRDEPESPVTATESNPPPP